MKSRSRKAIVPPLVPVVTAVIAGITAGDAAQTSHLIFCIPPLGLLVSFFFLGMPCSHRLVLVICLTAGILSYFHMHGTRYPKDRNGHIRHYYNHSQTVIKGKIVSFARDYPHKRRWVLACTGIVVSDRCRPVKGRLLLNLYGPSEIPFGYGDRVQVKGPVRPPRNFANPGGFDYKTHLSRQGIYGSVHAGAGEVTLLSDRKSRGYGAWVKDLEKRRNRFNRFIIETLGPTPAGRILCALVTGKKDTVPPELRDLFAAAGASHILAISGLHLSILAVLFYTVFYSICSCSHSLQISGAARKAAGILMLLPLLCYTIFSGMAPSTLRAFAMTGMFALSFLMERENHPVNTLAGAGLVILMADPGALYSVSFQLSFTAVFFLILGFDGMNRLRWFEGLGRLAAIALSPCLVTLFAGLGTFALTTHYFHLVSLVQIPANLVLVPLMGSICLPAGLAALLTADMFPHIAAWLITVAGFLIDICMHWVQILANLPHAWFRVPGFTVYETLTVYGIMVTSFVFLKFGRNKWTLFLACAAAVAGIWSWGRPAFAPLYPQKAMGVTVLDVGQGNAAHIRTAEGHHILVDGGGFPGASGFDTGRYILAPYLWQQKITTLEAVILTHPDSDHMKGLVFILENFRVKRLVKNRDKADHRAYEKLMAVCKKRRIPVRIPGCGHGDMAWDATRIRFFQCRSLTPGFDVNENSLVFKLELGQFSMLFAGDIMEKREYALCRVLPHGLKAAILMAPHHGSQSSSSKFFLDKVDPESVIISCGFKNRYGFPHPDVLGRYREAGMNVFRTDIHGAVTITTSGYGYAILTHKGA